MVESHRRLLFTLFLFLFAFPGEGQSINTAPSQVSSGAAPVQPPLTAEQVQQIVKDGVAAALKEHQADAAAAMSKLSQTVDSANDALQKSQQNADDAERAKKADEAALRKLDKVRPPSAVIADSSLMPGDHVPCLLDRTTNYASRGMEDPKKKKDEVTKKDNDKNKDDDLATDLSKTEAMKAWLTAAKAATVEPDKEKQGLAEFAKMLSFKTSVAGTTFKASDVNNAAKNGLKAAGVTADDTAQGFAKSAVSKVAKDAAKEREDALQQTSYSPPKNVGCSMSIYPWNISRMVFGRTVADNYLAVQVIVRNTDQDNEFLIHDAELAVDAYSGQLERFQASHEKEAVRGVVVYGQNYDRNAVWTHGVEAIGTILGAVVAVPGGGNDILTAASGAFSAGFVPSFQKLFPDLSTHNLNNVNDLAFSAAAASRIVVPKGGSVPFVIFVPVKPLEQACWLQKGYTPSADVGVATACSSIYTPDGTQIESSQLTQPQATDAEKNKYFSPGLYPNGHLSKYWPYNPQTVAFKHWNAEALTALQKHAYAVVAGSHIKELNAAPALRSISCTNSTDNAVHIALLNNQAFTCSLMGADLDTVSTLRAESLANPSSKPIDATLTTSGDSTTGKATFPATTLASFTDPSYELYSVDRTGTATDLKQQLAVVPLPTLDAKTPFNPPNVTALKNVKDLTKQLTITGGNLQQVLQVKLEPSAGTAIFATPDVTSTPSSLILDFNPSDLSTLDNTQRYGIVFVLSADGQQTYNTKQYLPQ